MTTPVDLLDYCFGRDVERLHRLGPRVLAEMLLQLGAERLLMTDIEQRVRRYARLDPAALRYAGVPIAPGATGTQGAGRP
jgi:hypothetical protein